MCGIFFVLSKSDEIEKTKEMAMKSQYRGPESTVNIVHNNIVMTFHRLAINGLNKLSEQPFHIDGIYLLCNGEIYNSDELWNSLERQKTTNSDCEIIIEMYKEYGIEYTLQRLDGVFAMVMYDTNIDTLIIARDPFGVRPLFQVNNLIAFASEMKQINSLGVVNQFEPGTYSVIKSTSRQDLKYFTQCIGTELFTDYHGKIYSAFECAVKKRVKNTERKIGCLLSGGLDSSVVTAMVNKHVENLDTFSIGLQGSPDLLNARKVSDYLKTNHHEIIITEEEFLTAIPEVIRIIESYDTTTVRASVGNYLIAKYISENTDCKVIFNGDGADELMGGYVYLNKCPNETEFDFECRRLLKNIHFFDVLRSDRTISSNGLEARTPFLDKNFVQTYLSIPSLVRFQKYEPEKILFRNSILQYNCQLIPHDILFRKKEAFSDGVSSINKSWFSIIQSHADEFFNKIPNNYKYNIPETKEQAYYRFFFEKEYPNQEKIIPYFWMPKYSKTKDPSARTL
jgi:asparagine synthase (glutamine-hydrolysing)